MQLRSGKTLSSMSRPPANNINPHNNPQNVAQKPVVTAIEEPALSTPVRTTTPEASTTPFFSVNSLSKTIHACFNSNLSKLT